jgi:hypothetical protein
MVIGQHGNERVVVKGDTNSPHILLPQSPTAVNGIDGRPHGMARKPLVVVACPGRPASVPVR